MLPGGIELDRLDYAADAWSGPPENAIAWWQSEIPSPETRKVHWAPNEVLLNLFLELENNPAEQDMRYVLALLLVRRRILRLEFIENETLKLFCPKSDTEYLTPVVTPDESRIAEIQAKLEKLLFQ